MSKILADKVPLVTGGTSGIGLATAERFAVEGAQVFITGRRQTELDGAVKQIGASAIGVQGDIANLADLDRLYQVIQEKAGRLDVLFANAGGGAFVPLREITEAHFDKYAWLSCRCYNGGEPDNGKSPPAGSGRGLSTGFALIHSPWTPKQAVARHYAMIDKSNTRRRIDVVLERVGGGEDH